MRNNRARLRLCVSPSWIIRDVIFWKGKSRLNYRWLLGLFLLMLTGAVRAEENWPDYRGPHADGHSAATGLPLTFSATQKVTWKTPIHGRGWSSPIIWGEQIWLTTATPDGREMFVVCVHRETGKILLDKRLFTNAEPETIHDFNSYASPSPVIEAGRVYVHFGNYGTACLDTKTFETVWQRRDLPVHFSVGPGSSPVLYKDLLFLTMDGIDVQYVVALNKKTGKTVWKKDRETDWNQGDRVAAQSEENRKSFTTPSLITIEGKPVLLSPAAKAVYAYEPETGKELWHIRHNGYSGSSRSLVGQGMAFVNIGYDRSELLAVRLDGNKGNVTDSHIAWQVNRAVPYKPSPLLVDDLLFMVSDGGIVTCLEAKTGTAIWQERIGGQYSASLLCAEGRIYCCSEDGKVVVFKAGRKFEKQAENMLPDGFMASPAISGKALFLRSKTHLYRIEN
jgi:outer membrane protein assembly factor BamB